MKVVVLRVITLKSITLVDVANNVSSNISKKEVFLRLELKTIILKSNNYRNEDMNDINKGKNWNLTTKKHSIPNVARNVNVINSGRSALSRPKSLVSIDKIAEENSLFFDISTEVLDSIAKKENKFERFVSTFGDIIKRPERMNVTIVVVEAKNLPDAPEDGSAHGIYCKFSLGNDTFKTKTVPKNHHPQWKEIFNITQSKDSELNISIWDKGKDKYFMGSCVINLIDLEKEKTHDIWQPLDDEFGSLHLLITVCGMRSDVNRPSGSFDKIRNAKTRYAWYNMNVGDGGAVGQLRVTVHSARGLPLSPLGARPLALCVLELDNARVQTHAMRAAPDPHWNHTYIFDVEDIMSTLDVIIYDEMMGNKGEVLGTVNIPLLRINNGEMRWYALKDRNQKIAKGNCPRVLLEMYLVWNPVNASLRLFRPKKCKYIKAPAKFDVALILSNLEFVRDTFKFLVQINEIAKDLLEWDSRDHCVVGLVAWMGVCYFLELWMLPLMLLVPFFCHWIRLHLLKPSGHIVSGSLSPNEELWENAQNEKNDKTLRARIQDLHEMTLTITRGIDYLDSIYEKLKNLVNFSVPYLSYLVILLLLASSFLLYCIPINFIMMGLGVYKFMRKYTNPGRIANNDILDFLSRVPDDDTLKLWKEYKVPEPVQGAFQKKSRRSFSS